MKGRYYWNLRTVDSLKKSVTYFQEAIQDEPNYALPYAGLADAYNIMGFGFVYLMDSEEAGPKAIAAAEKEHSFGMILLRQEWCFDPIRSDPRFQNLLRRLHYPGIPSSKYRHRFRGFSFGFPIFSAVPTQNSWKSLNREYSW